MLTLYQGIYALCPGRVYVYERICSSEVCVCFACLPPCTEMFTHLSFLPSFPSFLSSFLMAPMFAIFAPMFPICHG